MEFGFDTAVADAQELRRILRTIGAQAPHNSEPRIIGQTTEYCQHEPPVRRRGIGPGVAKRTEGGAPLSDSSKNVQQIAR